MIANLTNHKETLRSKPLFSNREVVTGTWSQRRDPSDVVLGTCTHWRGPGNVVPRTNPRDMILETGS